MQGVKSRCKISPLDCSVMGVCSAGLAGLAIANSLDIALMANWVLRQLSETEIAMNRWIYTGIS